MISGKKLLNKIWEIAKDSKRFDGVKTEKESFVSNEKEWERVMVEGEAAEELLKNESFKKGLEVAQNRFGILVGELLKHNDREIDLKLKAEINNMISVLNGFYGNKKRAKETLETFLIKKFNLEDK